MITLDDLGYEELSEEDKRIVLRYYIQHLLDLDFALFKKELERCTTELEVKQVYNKHTDKNSVLGQLTKSFKNAEK